MVTPFDEASVKLLLTHNVDYIKIASCSFGDWPLLEAIAKAGKPVVASCAGAREEVVDNVVAFFKNRNIFLILQHCIGNYPTAPEEMNVGQVSDIPFFRLDSLLMKSLPPPTLLPWPWPLVHGRSKNTLH
jgi:N-acetylneuraminate synthase